MNNAGGLFSGCEGAGRRVVGVVRLNDRGPERGGGLVL